MAREDFKFHTALRVRWTECDVQGVVYYGAYMDYLEVGQSEYFRNLGFSIYKTAETGYFDTAVVKVTTEFKSPARLDEMLDVYIRVSRIGDSSITVDAEIYPQDSDRIRIIAEVIYVGYDAAAGATKPVPEAVRELVHHYESTGETLPLGRFPELARAVSS